MTEQAPAIDERGTEVPCEDGLRLDVKLLVPPAPRAVVVAGHAMMADRRTLDARGDGLVRELARQHLAVLWPDLRGHGRSGLRAAAGGRWTYDDLVEHDAPALFRWARGRFPALPIVALGHSLFGHVAVAALARRPELPVAALVLLGVNVWVRAFEPRPARWARKRLLLEGVGAVCRAAGYFPARRLRLGSTDESAPYFAQFLDWARSGDWRSRDGFSYLAAMPRVAVPTLAISGAGDRLAGHPECVARFTARLGRARHLVAGRVPAQRDDEPGRDLPASRRRGVALPFDPDHMGLVTDPRSRPLWRRLAAFALDPEGALEDEAPAGPAPPRRD